jgi:hypothetical protein
VTLEEFLQSLPKVKDTFEWRIIFGSIRGSRGPREVCPLTAMADLKGCRLGLFDVCEINKIIKMSEGDVRKIIYAADCKNHYHEE